MATLHNGTTVSTTQPWINKLYIPSNMLKWDRKVVACSSATSACRRSCCAIFLGSPARWCMASSNSTLASMDPDPALGRTPLCTPPLLEPLAGRGKEEEWRSGGVDGMEVESGRMSAFELGKQTGKHNGPPGCYWKRAVGLLLTAVRGQLLAAVKGLCLSQQTTTFVHVAAIVHGPKSGGCCKTG
jgi:hypothetical protein